MTAREGNAGPSARMRGLATKTERQPFAPFRRIFQLQPSGSRRDALAPHAFESRIGDLTTCFANPLILLKPLPLPFVKSSAGFPADLGMEWLKY
jgi:hypothetical protein